MTDEFVNHDIDPGFLIRLLISQGWSVSGEWSGVYTRVKRDPEDRSSLLVPLDRQAPDYEELLVSCLGQLRRDHPELWRSALAVRLGSSPKDVLQFRKETAAPAGLISWSAGQQLIEITRATLIAGAKAYLSRERYFGNRNGQFAARYLDTVLMGQTGIGSYIVTALAPSQAKVSRHGSPEGRLDDLELVRGREITASVAGSLSAVASAIATYRQDPQFGVFDEAVRSGVSFELLAALRDFVAGAEGADVTVEWQSGESSLLDGIAERTTVEFTPPDVEVLSQAAIHLSASPTRMNFTVRGRVHLLTKQVADEIGVVGIDDGRHKYRVRLSSDAAYHDAVLAHDEEREVQVEGELVREGNLSWIYGAQLIEAPAVERIDQPSLFGEQVTND